MRDEDEEDKKTPPVSNEAFWLATTHELHEFLKQPRTYQEIVEWAFCGRFKNQYALRHALAWLSFKNMAMCDEQCCWRQHQKIVEGRPVRVPKFVFRFAGRAQA